MRLGNERSSNVEDRRGRGLGIPIAGGGIGAVIIAVLYMLFSGTPGDVRDSVQPGGAPQYGQPAQPGQPGQPEDPNYVFVTKVLRNTEKTWGTIFPEQVGREYQDPTLVVFDGGYVQSACGTGQSASGPFYCPLDGKVYIDLSFYQELQDRFRAPGDFAQAYVIAHEVGHHVQNLLGISRQVSRARQQSGDERESNALSVAQELQADCYAGVWANRANEMEQILESGDVEEGLNAASAIGDDRLQKQAQGYVVPDSFTHGSSAQRVRWFRRGLQSGQMRDCDTFAAGSF